MKHCIICIVTGKWDLEIRQKGSYRLCGLALIDRNSIDANLGKLAQRKRNQVDAKDIRSMFTYIRFLSALQRCFSFLKTALNSEIEPRTTLKWNNQNF